MNLGKDTFFIIKVKKNIKKKKKKKKQELYKRKKKKKYIKYIFKGIDGRYIFT